MFASSAGRYNTIMLSSCLKSCRSSAIRLFLPCLNSALVATSGVVNNTVWLQNRQVRSKSGKNGKDISTIFVPVPVKVSENPDDISIGEELSSTLKKSDIVKALTDFYKRPAVKKLSEENGIINNMYHQVFLNFKNMCVQSEVLPVDLHIALSDIIQGAGHVDDLFPYFLRHARQMYPHLECMDDLKKISDLRLPANWYPEARALNRKIIFHAGPTNSGKTFHALQRFTSAKSGVYCGPLKMLAVEVHAKTNEKGTPCDLVTGEEKRFGNPDGSPSSHVACTVEMTSVNMQCEIAVIDEIQMVRDPGRGWAWTRALLGVPAKEVHLCGEEAAIPIVKEILAPTGEEIEICKYERLTKLTIEQKALQSLDNIQPGDCIVCFSKNDIFSVSLQVEQRGYECAVIYGGLPPGTKLAQANKFNDPNHPCKIMVATDAVGMGLNLSIRRMVFYSLIKPVLNKKGEKEMDIIPTHQALQIAGRAGRYGTQFSEGFVTTFRRDDLPILREILSRPVEPIAAAGLHPTADQIELFAYHLPHATLSNLLDIFVNLCEVDTSAYFMCNIEDFKFLADMIQHVPLPLRARYVFCCAPINRRVPYICSMFLKFTRQYSKNEPMTFEWLCRTLGSPFKTPKTITDLVHLEAVFDVLDTYLWLSYRFPDLFLDIELVRDMQKELDHVIQQGVFNISRLLKASDNVHTAAVAEKEDSGDSETLDNMDDSQWRYGKSILDNSNEPAISSKMTPKDHGKGRLTEYLISQGLLTPDMIKKLQKEWQDGDSDLEEKPRIKKIGKSTKKKPSGK